MREHVNIFEDEVIMICVVMGWFDDEFVVNHVVSRWVLIDDDVSFVGFDE